MLFVKQGNNLKCLVMPLLINHTTLQEQGSIARARDVTLNEKPH